MDDIVKVAMAKWPNVPHCYAWLALDARGQWRMRDERCQALQLAGDKIHNAGLIAFINRNYQGDAQGRYYFQNGPQKVYVDLAATPFICHCHQNSFKLHTGEELPDCQAVYLLDDGQIVFEFGTHLAQVDDRDLAQVLAHIHQDHGTLSDEQILALLEHPPGSSPVASFHFKSQSLPLLRTSLSTLMRSKSIQAQPRPEN